MRRDVHQPPSRPRRAGNDPQAVGLGAAGSWRPGALFSAQHSGCCGWTPVHRIPIGFSAPHLALWLGDLALELPAVDKRKSIKWTAAKPESHLTEGEFL